MLKCPPLTTEWSWTCDPASLRRAAQARRPQLLRQVGSAYRQRLQAAPTGSARSPRTVADAVLASIRSCKARILPTGGPQPLPISQTFPGARRVQPGPPAAVLMIALMGATREVAMPVGETSNPVAVAAASGVSRPARAHRIRDPSRTGRRKPCHS
jgi:hypothetical protein